MPDVGDCTRPRRPLSRRVRALLPGLAAALFLAGCGGTAPDDGSLQLLLQPDQGQTDPFQDPASVYLRIVIDDGTSPPLVDRTFTLATGASYELDHVPPGSPRNFRVDVEDSTQTPLYEGTKLGVDLVPHQHNTVTVLMRHL